MTICSKNAKIVFLKLIAEIDAGICKILEKCIPGSERGIAAAMERDLGCLASGRIRTRRGGGGHFRPACLPTIFSYRYSQNLLRVSLKHAEISGNTLSSGNHLGFPTIPANFGEIVGEKYSIWLKVQRNVQKIRKFA